MLGVFSWFLRYACCCCRPCCCFCFVGCFLFGVPLLGSSFLSVPSSCVVSVWVYVFVGYVPCWYPFGFLVLIPSVDSFCWLLLLVLVVGVCFSLLFTCLLFVGIFCSVLCVSSWLGSVMCLFSLVPYGGSCCWFRSWFIYWFLCVALVLVHYVVKV